MPTLPKTLTLQHSAASNFQLSGTMAHLPIAKLGALLIRTMMKPLAKSFKNKTKQNPFLLSMCHSIGQFQHKARLKIAVSGRTDAVKNMTVKPLAFDQAVEEGSDILGEILIFSVAAVILTFEYTKSAQKSMQEKLLLQAQVEKEQLELENKFQQLETRIRALEEKIPKIPTTKGWGIL